MAQNSKGYTEKSPFHPCPQATQFPFLKQLLLSVWDWISSTMNEIFPRIIVKGEVWDEKKKKASVISSPE